MFRKVQFFIVTMFVASTVAAIAGNISLKESHFGSSLPSYNMDDFIYCDYGFDTEKLYI